MEQPKDKTTVTNDLLSKSEEKRLWWEAYLSYGGPMLPESVSHADKCVEAFKKKFNLE